MKTIMFKFSLLLFITLFYEFISFLVFSQAPDKMSFQAVIRNSKGELVANQTVGIRIQIKQGSQFGAAVYVERRYTNTDANGMISIEIGGGPRVLGSITDIDWSNGPYFLLSEIDPEGGKNYSIIAESQLLTVPYALHAKTAENVPGVATQASADELKAEIEELQLLAGIKIKDIDGNVYKVVKIGNQTWMAENLKTVHYRNGDPIPNVNDDTLSDNSSSGGYSVYKNLPENGSVYGNLYNWYAVTDPRNICPTGWHIPAEDDWNTLIDYMGGVSIAGYKLIETGTKHWIFNSTFATNESGFTALPGGYCGGPDLYNSMNSGAYFWSNSDQLFNDYGLFIVIYDNDWVVYHYYDKKWGLSVRCLKD